MLSKILVLVDGTDNSLRALTYAAALAKISSGELLVMTAGKADKRGSEASPLDKALRLQANDEAVKLGNKILGDAKLLLEQQGCRAQYLLEFATPITAALQTIEKYGCDTIVVGSRGLGGIKVLLSDSVSSKLVREAPLPVIVVK